MSPIVHSLFEEGYLRRDLVAVAEDPEVAIAELVANAWDAGATEVNIDIPDAVGGEIRVADNGVGMSRDQFRDRWMRHGYLRVKHQGELAEFPPGKQCPAVQSIRPERDWQARIALLLRPISG